MPKLLFIVGTRPEAIKLCPLILHIGRFSPDYTISVCATAQHRGLLDQVLEVFGVVPDYDLDVMRPGQTLTESAAAMLAALGPVIETEKPDLVIVQGDTTTTFAGALAAFYARVPVAHVEAGLRTGNPSRPFPEEINRLMTTRLASLHLAPTVSAQQNLVSEGVDAEAITVTGNTAIDAVLYVRDALESGRVAAPEWPWLDPSRRLILATAHRRESFGAALEGVFDALAELAARPDVQVVVPVHPNPRVREMAARRLEHAGVHLLEPLSYVPFVDLMRRAALLISDSGGIQEEAPALGKPILVLREETERPEAVEAGAAVLVGTDRSRIVAEAALLLDDEEEFRRRARVRYPFGDGRACSRILVACEKFFRRSTSTRIVSC